MQKGSPENSAGLARLLGEAKKWALKHIKSNELQVRGMAERLLNLHAEHAALSSAVAKIAQHKIELPDDLSNGSGRFEASLKELPVDLAADLNHFRAELKEFIPQILPGIGTPTGINFRMVPKGTIIRLNEFNNRARKLLQRASAVPAVLSRLPLGYKRRMQQLKRGRKPKIRPR